MVPSSPFSCPSSCQEALQHPPYARRHREALRLRPLANLPQCGPRALYLQGHHAVAAGRQIERISSKIVVESRAALITMMMMMMMMMTMMMEMIMVMMMMMMMRMMMMKTMMMMTMMMMVIMMMTRTIISTGSWETKFQLRHGSILTQSRPNTEPWLRA